MAKIDDSKDYYATLGVPKDADEGTIKRAKRALVLIHHPDRNLGREDVAKKMFQEVQAAYEVLVDREARAKYDAARKKKLEGAVPPYVPRNSRPAAGTRNSYSAAPGGTYYNRAPPPKPTPQQYPPPRPKTQKGPGSFYNNGADRFTHANFRPPPTAQRPDAREKEPEAKANVFTAWQKMKTPRADTARNYDPNNPNNRPRSYTQNNPNGTPFGRSNSTRAPSDKKGFNPGTPGGDEGQAKSSYRSNYERPAASPVFDENTSRSPKAQPMAEDVPFAEANRFRTPYSSTKAGERTSMYGDGIGRSSSLRNSPTHGQRSTATNDAGFNSDSGRPKQRSSYTGPQQNTRFPHMYDSSDDDEAEDFRTGTKHRGPPPAEPQQSKWGQGAFGAQQRPSSSDASSSAFKSRSAESINNINMKFSPSDWHGKFEGQSDYFAPSVPKVSTTKGRTSPTRGRQHQRSATEKGPFAGVQSQPPPISPFSRSQSSQMPPPPSGPPPTEQAPHATKFAQEKWAETFKEPSWALPLKTKDTSPRRGSATTKRTNPARKPSAVPENNAGVGKQTSKPKPKYQAFAEDDAMDIDTEPPSATETSIPKSTGTGTTAKNNTQTKSAVPASQPAAPGLNLNGMKTVEPFTQADTGLSGLGALGDQLPFPSQASNDHPLKLNNPRQMKYPPVPAAPAVPTTLDPTATNEYLKQFEGYVRQYRQYRSALTAHLAARNEEFDNLDDNFVRQRGERTQKLGFASYLHKNKEDEGVLEAFKYAQELHIKALEQCDDVRRKASKQSQFSSV
ncbi:hypothetical protein DM02DRAFT_196195 [Periconia macrospinosa]|uniref:J domain-containing protein n=1 Tax=Periconia macrospinosa TaxID=97972 RepID=A0A2V1D839_9PLEO|nr:hypothetical protein DM02DRAFT_196195 [Periconia macrospinosa]